MNQEYNIKGIEKIINQAGKERLSKHYNVDINSDFEEIIKKDFENRRVPNGLEVASYFSLVPEELNKRNDEGEGFPNISDVAREIWEQYEQKRALVGVSYMDNMIEFASNSREIINGTYGNILFFLIDEPIRTEELANMMYHKEIQFGVVQYQNLLMGQEYYEEHINEFELAQKDIDKYKNKINILNKYIENFINEFQNVEFTEGYGPRPQYTETEEIKKKKEICEKMLTELTDKNVDELNLKDFITLKRSLEQEEQKFKKEFEEKFSKKENEGR